MARKLTDRNQTDAFIQKVLGEARHHASGMVGPVNTIYEFMINRIDFDRDSVEVFERNGKISRTTWVSLGATRLVFTYSYDRRCILLKLSNLRGREVTSFGWNEARQLTIDKLSEELREQGIN